MSIFRTPLLVHSPLLLDLLQFASFVSEFHTISSIGALVSQLWLGGPWWLRWSAHSMQLCENVHVVFCTQSEQVHTVSSMSECHLRCNCHQCNVSSFEPKSAQSQKLKHDAFKRQKNIHRLPTIQIPRTKSYQRTASCFHFWVKIMQFLTVTLVTGLDWWSDIQH